MSKKEIKRGKEERRRKGGGYRFIAYLSGQYGRAVEHYSQNKSAEIQEKTGKERCNVYFFYFSCLSLFFHFFFISFFVITYLQQCHYLES